MADASTVNLFEGKSGVVDNLILFFPEKERVAVFEETSGCQLTSEDYAEGIDAYIMATVISVEMGSIGEVDPDGEQYPLFYSTEECDNEYELVEDWIEDYFGEIPKYTVIRY